MTFEQIEKVLFGGIGLGLDTVERMTMSQVLNAFNGYCDKERNLQIVTWESTRWQTWILYNLQVDKKSKIKDPTRFITFDWDPKPEKITDEEWKEINSKFPDKFRHGV